jgi:hypothetical protein
MRRAGLLAAAVLALLAVLIAGSAPRSSAASSGYPRSFAATDDIGRRAETPGKDAVHRLQIVANLREELPDEPVVILLGGSSARESTVDDGDWAAQVERYSGAPVATFNLGCRHDTYALDREVAELLPKDMPAIVYIGVNLGRFASPPSSPTITLPDPASPPPKYFQHVYSVQKKVQTPATKRFYVSYWLERRWPEFKARYAYNFGSLESVIQTCLARGLHPVLLDLPRDLAIIGHAFDEPVATYKAGCAWLSRKYGIPWLTFVQAANLKDSDYFDLFHLVEPGRVKYQKLLSQKTAQLLDKYGLAQPQPTPSPTPTPTVTPTTSVTPAPTARPTVSPTPISTYTPTLQPGA